MVNLFPDHLGIRLCGESFSTEKACEVDEMLGTQKTEGSGFTHSLFLCSEWRRKPVPQCVLVTPLVWCFFRSVHEHRGLNGKWKALVILCLVAHLDECPTMVCVCVCVFLFHYKAHLTSLMELKCTCLHGNDTWGGRGSGVGSK